MEKTIKCPECGDEATPEFGMCPTCSYKYRPFDYQNQGLSVHDFNGINDYQPGSNNLFGKIKVIGFVIVFIFIVIIFINK
ncbi:MAG: hypothetical protein C0603_02650 [Denitrovibrio sp.]|nr:MAG: hypothetical protein C0603_02650 [Denitrovibrio sp.]